MTKNTASGYLLAQTSSLKVTAFSNLKIEKPLIIFETADLYNGMTAERINDFAAATKRYINHSLYNKTF
jgi:hypothetical protein